jgi:PIN domain nuclease of toxin-antitoxin system
MRVLTDTHTLVWILTEDESLSRAARRALDNGEMVCSVVNLWELMLKKNKPGAMVSEPQSWWFHSVTQPGLDVLSVRVPHILKLGDLAGIHRDPFDRMLVAQALVEGIPLITRDTKLAQYGVQTIW